MEADWGAETGAELPVIHVSWDGFVDLQLNPEAVVNLSETHDSAAQGSAALTLALMQWNAAGSAFFTSKCDVWTLTAEEIDPDEFGAEQSEAQAGFACYIDLIERDETAFTSYPAHEERARRIVAALSNDPIQQCRVDLTIRAAINRNSEGYGYTLYVAGCGADELAAITQWEIALRAAVATTIRIAATDSDAGARASSSIG